MMKKNTEVLVIRHWLDLKTTLEGDVTTQKPKPISTTNSRVAGLMHLQVFVATDEVRMPTIEPWVAAQAGLNALSAGGSDVVTGTIGNMFDKNYSKNAGMDMDPYGAGKLGYNAWGWVLDNWDRVMGNNTGVQTPQIPEGEDFTY